MESRYGDVLKRIGSQVGGGLVEIWLTDVSYEMWAKVVQRLELAGYDISLTKNGVKESMPVKRGMFYTDELEDSYCLQVKVGRQLWTSPLHSTETIEFQGDPELIQTDEDLDDVKNFMTAMANSVQRTAMFIPETMHLEGVGRYLVVEP